MKALLVFLAALPLACTSPTGDDGGPTPGYVYLTVINETDGSSITDIYYRWADDTDGDVPDGYWRWHWGYNEDSLEPGDRVSLEVEPGLYDIRLKAITPYPDSDFDKTRFDALITENGYTWELTQEEIREAH